MNGIKAKTISPLVIGNYIVYKTFKQFLDKLYYTCLWLYLNDINVINKILIVLFVLNFHEYVVSQKVSSKPHINVSLSMMSYQNLLFLY